MAEYGMSTRTIAAVIGVSQRTVLRDLAGKPRGPVLGRDGKRYPGNRLTAETQAGLIGYVHRRRHAGATIRAVVADLAAEDMARSAGWVSSVLRRWRCPDCSGVAYGSPEHGSGRG